MNERRRAREERPLAAADANKGNEDEGWKEVEFLAVAGSRANSEFGFCLYHLRYR